MLEEVILEILVEALETTVFIKEVFQKGVLKMYLVLDK